MAFNILIVDDSLPMRSVIKKTIKVSGFKLGQLFEAPDGRAALDILKEQWLDLVLTDYSMPDMNGLELVENIKKDELLKAIPVVVITAEGSQQKLEEFIKKGAVGFIKKPFTPEEIREKLNQVLGECGYGEGISENGDEGLDF